MPHYQVVVGNLGTVYDGENEETARQRFAGYRDMSRNGYGRCANEPVYLLVEGSALLEYVPAEPFDGGE